MYENLWIELQRKRITYKKVGELLGVHVNSVYNKIHGNTMLSLEEAKAIHREYFSEFPFLTLFEKK